VPTDAAGVPTVLVAEPGVVESDAVFRPTGGYEHRQLQLGFRVTF
jgi:hypothetical protein